MTEPVFNQYVYSTVQSLIDNIALQRLVAGRLPKETIEKMITEEGKDLNDEDKLRLYMSAEKQMRKFLNEFPEETKVILDQYNENGKNIISADFNLAKQVEIDKQ